MSLDDAREKLRKNVYQNASCMDALVNNMVNASCMDALVNNMVNWDPPQPHPCRMEAVHDGTRNMSRAVHLLYLFRHQIGGGMAVLCHGFVST